MAADNKALGQFDLVGIPAAPRGVPQIEVTFDIDANGIVNVSAKDKATNKEQQIRIQASGGLSDADIEKMVQDAEANAEADKERRESVEIRNQGESLVHATEKSLEELGDKLSADEKQEAESAIADLKDVLADENASTETLQEKVEALTQASMKLGEIAYRQAQEEQAAAGEAEAADTANADAGAASGDDDVLDADFTEVDEGDAKSA